jgi:hypothetical protein
MTIRLHYSFLGGSLAMSSFDQESIVYGLIRDIPAGGELEAYRRRRTNWSAIQELPSSLDDDWPFLSREMFSMPGPDVYSGTYHTQLIHFAASYNSIEYEWERWISRFEAMLRSMYWSSATVHLETELSGKHTFSWESSGTGHNPNDSELKMVCEWERESNFSPRG